MAGHKGAAGPAGVSAAQAPISSCTRVMSALVISSSGFPAALGAVMTGLPFRVREVEPPPEVAGRPRVQGRNAVQVMAPASVIDSSAMKSPHHS